MPHSLRETRTGEFSRIFSGRTRREREREREKDTKTVKKLSLTAICLHSAPRTAEKRNASSESQKDYYY